MVLERYVQAGDVTLLRAHDDLEKAKQLISLIEERSEAFSRATFENARRVEEWANEFTEQDRTYAVEFAEEATEFNDALLREQEKEQLGLQTEDANNREIESINQDVKELESVVKELQVSKDKLPVQERRYKESLKEADARQSDREEKVREFELRLQGSIGQLQKTLNQYQDALGLKMEIIGDAHVQFSFICINIHEPEKMFVVDVKREEGDRLTGFLKLKQKLSNDGDLLAFLRDMRQEFQASVGFSLTESENVRRDWPAMPLCFVSQLLLTSLKGRHLTKFAYSPLRCRRFKTTMQNSEAPEGNHDAQAVEVNGNKTEEESRRKVTPQAAAKRRERQPLRYTEDFATPSTVNLDVIGVVRSPYKERFGTPRQPNVTENTLGNKEQPARIELYKGSRFELGLRGLAEFEYCWVVSFFHLNQGFNPLVTPPRGPRKKQGVFATRSPHRPNSIGLSCIRITGVEEDKGIIHLLGVDLLDGTAVLDIKPYVPYCDAYPNARAGWLDKLKEDMKAPDTLGYHPPPEHLLRPVPPPGESRLSGTRLTESDANAKRSNDEKNADGTKPNGN